MANEAVEGAYGDPQMLVSVAAVQAKIWSAAGRLGEAHEVMLGARQEAADSRVTGPARQVLGLLEAELRLAGGDVGAARRRLAAGPLDDAIRPRAALVESAVLLAERKAARAAALVAPYLGEADVPSLTWRAQAGLLTALAGKMLHDRSRVGRGLDIALDAAEQEGFRRMFVAGGPMLRDLLLTAAPEMGVYRLVASNPTRAAPGAAGSPVGPHPVQTPASPAPPRVRSRPAQRITERRPIARAVR